MKITGNSTQKTIFKGEEALDVPNGEIVKIIDARSTQEIGDILLRTSSTEQPFVDLTSGNIWGSVIRNYTFMIIEYYELILK